MRDIKRIMEEYSDEYNLNGKPIKQGFKRNLKTMTLKVIKRRAGIDSPILIKLSGSNII